MRASILHHIQSLQLKLGHSLLVLTLLYQLIKISIFFQLKNCCIVNFGDDASNCQNKRQTLVLTVTGALGAPVYDNGKCHLSIVMLTF